MILTKETKLSDTLIIEAEYDSITDDLYYHVRYEDGEYAERNMEAVESVVVAFSFNATRLDTVKETKIIMDVFDEWFDGIDDEIAALEESEEREKYDHMDVKEAIENERSAV